MLSLLLLSSFVYVGYTYQAEDTNPKAKKLSSATLDNIYEVDGL
jgi:hypothetical protein